MQRQESTALITRKTTSYHALNEKSFELQDSKTPSLEAANIDVLISVANYLDLQSSVVLFNRLSKQIRQTSQSRTDAELSSHLTSSKQHIRESLMDLYHRVVGNCRVSHHLSMARAIAKKRNLLGRMIAATLKPKIADGLQMPQESFQETHERQWGGRSMANLALFAALNPGAPGAGILFAYMTLNAYLKHHRLSCKEVILWFTTLSDQEMRIGFSTNNVSNGSFTEVLEEGLTDIFRNAGGIPLDTLSVEKFHLTVAARYSLFSPERKNQLQNEVAEIRREFDTVVQQAQQAGYQNPSEAKKMGDVIRRLEALAREDYSTTDTQVEIIENLRPNLPHLVAGLLLR